MKFSWIMPPNWAALGQQGLHTICICNPYVTPHSISSQAPLNVGSLACFSNLVRPVVLITELFCPNDISMADSRSPPTGSLADGFRLPCTGAHTCVHAHQKRNVLILLLGCFIMINSYIWQLFFPALEKTHDQMLKRESANATARTEEILKAGANHLLNYQHPQVHQGSPRREAWLCILTQVDWKLWLWGSPIWRAQDLGLEERPNLQPSPFFSYTVGGARLLCWKPGSPWETPLFVITAWVQCINFITILERAGEASWVLQEIIKNGEQRNLK